VLYTYWHYVCQKDKFVKKAKGNQACLAEYESTWASHPNFRFKQQ
jgi:hypothetical protein